MATLSAEFKITDLPKFKEVLSILTDMLGDGLIPTEYKERIAKIIKE